MVFGYTEKDFKAQEFFCEIVTQKQTQKAYFRPCERYTSVITFTEKSCSENITKIPINKFKRGSIFCLKLAFHRIYFPRDNQKFQDSYFSEHSRMSASDDGVPRFNMLSRSAHKHK